MTTLRATIGLINISYFA